MPWDHMLPASNVEQDPAQITALKNNLRGQVIDGHAVTDEDIENIIAEVRKAEVYKNSLYTAHVRRHPGVIHISIKRNDRAPVHDWRHLQQIKNDIVGPEHEAIELYPAESRVVDTANQYHLWVFDDPTYRVPMGFPAGLKMDPRDTDDGTRQRPLGEL